VSKAKKHLRIPCPPILPGPALRSLIHLAESSESVARAAVLDAERHEEQRDLALQTADGIRRAIDEIAEYIKRYEDFWSAYIALDIQDGASPRDLTIDIGKVKAEQAGIDVDKGSEPIFKMPIAIISEDCKFLDEDGESLIEIPKGIYHSDGTRTDVPLLPGLGRELGSAEEEDG